MNTSGAPTLEQALEMARAQPRTASRARSRDSPAQAFSFAAFRDFLRKSHCDENLDFILATDAFVGADAALTEADFPLKPWTDNVYSQFIRRDSPRECNLPQGIRECFDRCHATQSAPDRAHIRSARQHVITLLRDAFTRFLDRQRRCSSSNYHEQVGWIRHGNRV